MTIINLFSAKALHARWDGLDIEAKKTSHASLAKIGSDGYRKLFSIFNGTNDELKSHKEEKNILKLN